MKTLHKLCISTFFIVTFSFANTFYINTTGSDDNDGSEGSPFATIQHGIDAATNGDTVLVSAGTYVENINYNSKNIAVIGENRENTTIDGSSNNERVVTFENGEDTTAVLSGFSIMYGNGGIIVDESSPKLENLIIAYNQVNNYGGGIYAHESQNLIITDCDIFLNFSIGAWGGGIYLSDANADMTNVVIANCVADSGNAIFINSSNLNILNCTFYDPNPPLAGSFVWEGDNSINIMNSIITVRSIYEGYYYGYNQNSNIEISYSLLDIGDFYNFEYEGTGNVFGYSRLCLSDSTDFTLAQNSPAVGSGQNGVNMGAYGIGCDDKKIAIHVSESASVQNDGWGYGTEDYPFPSINEAVEKSAWSVAEDGGFISDTIMVHDGVYTESIDLPAYPDYYSAHGTWYLKSVNGPNYTKIFNEYIEAYVYGGVIFEGFHFDGMGVEGYGVVVKTNNSIITNSQWDGSSSEFHYNHCTIINNEIVEFNSIYNSILLNSGENVNYMDYTLNDIGRDDNGNISGVNPIFCDQDNEDFSLAENSPGVGAGENGSNMGALGIGCEAIALAPIIEEIADQYTNEDQPLIVNVSAISEMNYSLTFYAESDRPELPVYMDGSTLSIGVEADWNGSGNITVIVIDDVGSSDTTSFQVTVIPINDPPQGFDVLYPTISDIFSTHANSDTLIDFHWEESQDVDSDVTYQLTIELDFFGNTYTDVHENINDTTISIPANSLDPLLNVTAQTEATFTYYVHAFDGEHTVSSDIGEFILSREVLGINDGLSVPETFTLHQNYPNPFNPVTKLRYDLPQDSQVKVTVYDMLGNVINNLVHGNQSSGYKSVQWNATNNQGQQVSAGVYLYSIEAGDFRQTKKMILLK